MPDTADVTGPSGIPRRLGMRGKVAAVGVVVAVVRAISFNQCGQRAARTFAGVEGDGRGKACSVHGFCPLRMPLKCSLPGRGLRHDRRIGQ